jgi:uncharacterized protein YigE (DUF2233 family)
MRSRKQQILLFTTMSNLFFISLLFGFSNISICQTIDSTSFNDISKPLFDIYSPSFLDPEEQNENLSFEEKTPLGYSFVNFKGFKFYIYKIRKTSRNIHLEGYDNTGRPKYSTLKNFVSSVGRENSVDLDFAMNGGMYEGNGRPVGLFVSNGKIIQQLDTQYTNPNEVNFYMQPNGVFYSYYDRSGKLYWNVATTKSYNILSKSCKIKDATQSGPILIDDCLINKAFGTRSSNKKIRNAVGLSDEFIYFVMSYSETNFYDMAYFMQTYLRVQNALYLDGVVSQFYYHPKRKFFGSSVPIGPIISVYE